MWWSTWPAGNPSAEVLPLAVHLLSDWGRRPGLPPARKPELNRALAELQGASGALIGWQVAGPMPVAAAAALIGRVALPGQAPEPLTGVASEWRTELATSTESPLHLGSGKGSKGTVAWLAVTDLDVPEVTAGQFLVSGDGGLRIWLNGHVILERDTARPLAPASGSVRYHSRQGHESLARRCRFLVPDPQVPPALPPQKLQHRPRAAHADGPDLFGRRRARSQALP